MDALSLTLCLYAAIAPRETWKFRIQLAIALTAHPLSPSPGKWVYMHENDVVRLTQRNCKLIERPPLIL